MNRITGAVAATIIVVLSGALIVVLATGDAGPGSATAASPNAVNVNKIVREQRAINKRVIAALRRNKTARGDIAGLQRSVSGLSSVQGAQGPQGPAGPPGPIAGTPAGGALNGSFPNPGLAAGAVGVPQLGAIPVAFLRGQTQSIPSGSGQVLTFDTRGFLEAELTSDPYDLHSDTTNPTRITVKESGFYYAVANAAWESSATGVRRLSIGFPVPTGRRSRTLQRENPTVGDAHIQSGGVLVRLNAGDYIELLAGQTTGGDLDVTPLQFGLFHIGPLA